MAIDNHIQAVFKKILRILSLDEQELVISALERITHSLTDTAFMES